MLSEAERRSLEEIEQRLLAEEPRLARALNRPRPWLLYLVLVVFGGLSVLLLSMAAVGAAFQCLLVVAGALVLHRFPLRLR